MAAEDWATVTNYRYLVYDDLGNLWLDETRTVLGFTLWSTTTIHDAWQTRTYDPRGNRTDYEQNALGQLVKVTEYNVNSAVYNTTYVYDLQGNLTSVTDAANNVTTITYDLLGRKQTMLDPDMGSWQYQYDAVGNLTGQRDGRNQWLYLEYDDLNRLIRKRRDTASTGPKVAEYFYDASGQKGLLDKSLAYDSAGTTVQVETDAVTYDNRNRLTQLNRAGAETTYTYDANSNRLSAIDKTTSDTDLDGEFDDSDFSKSTGQALNIDPASNKLLGFTQTFTKVRGTRTLSILNTNVAYTLDANGALTSDGLRDFEYEVWR